MDRRRPQPDPGAAIISRREQGESAEENWGRITLVLERNGDFEMHNDRYPHGPLGFGTWATRGDVLTFTTGGDLATGAGEEWRYRWTLFRGALALEKLCCGPSAVTVAPLTRR